MNARASLWASLAIAASIGLAGCGGSSNKNTETGGDTPPTAAQLMTEKDNLGAATTAADNARIALTGIQPTDALIRTLSDAVTALDTAIKGLKYDETDKAEAEKSLREAQAALSTARTEKGKLDTAATEEANKDRIAKAKALLDSGTHFRLGLLAPTGNVGNNQATFGDDGLLIRVDAGQDGSFGEAFPALKKTTTPVAALSGWGGTEYKITNPTKPTTSDPLETTDYAKVYSNQEAAEDKAFSGELSGLGAPSAANAFTITIGTASLRQHIASPKFSSSGIDTFTGDDRKFDGTFMGATGTYNCTGASCTARSAGTKPSDGIELVSGTWTFTPRAGATLKQEDDHYLFFGWWMRTDEDGMPTWASAFYGTEGGTPASFGEITGAENNPASIGGSAKYNGKATGQFAIHEPIRASGDSGEFTADVELTATFSASHDGSDDDTPETGGVTGTIKGFMANGKPMPWSVELKRAGWDATAIGAFGPQSGDDGPEAQTVWSIDGNPASAGGMWSGRMYDDDSDDDNNTPTTAVGVFQAEAGDTHRMVGAFGANHSGN